VCEVAEADLASGQHFNAKRVRITKDGIKRIEPVWKRYQQMAVTLLDCIPQRDLQTHYHVNAKISERIRQRRDGLNDLFSGTAQAERGGVRTGRNRKRAAIPATIHDCHVLALGGRA
jgi:hypothetical protein